MVHGLSCSAACGIFPDQGSNLFPLHWQVDSFFFKINLFILFIYFWLHWVFVAACGLSLVVVSGGLLFVAVHGLLIAVASLVVEHGL